MKAAIIYNSQTGFTKKYAEWIAEVTGADCLELKAAKKQDFDSYDAIIFGGWACAGKISKISWFKSNMDKWSDKLLIAFCTGGSPAKSPDIEDFLFSNFNEAEREKVSVFYCPDGFNYEKMSASSKLMINIFQKIISGKKDKTEADTQMLKIISHSCDISDKKYIEPIINLLSKEK